MTPYIWFTADLHFGHKGILKYTDRPWDDLDVMRSVLIENWNAVVRPQDEVYVVGDFSFEKRAEAQATFAALHGHKHLIIGNHDGDPIRNLGWVSVDRMKTVKAEGHRFVLCHYPLLTWDQAHHGAFMLHGHSHGNLNILNFGTTRLDVGIDNHGDRRPFSLQEVLDATDGGAYAPVDHHRADS
jgi:calcineurin-like phosphoesterase family protein